MGALENKIVEFLMNEWQEGLRITTVPQAMMRLGVPDDEELRRRVGDRLKRIWRRRLRLRGLWRGLRWLRSANRRKVRPWTTSLRRLPSLLGEARSWNPAVYILSNDEKLIARLILNAGRVPSLEESAAVLDLDRSTVERGLRMLTNVGFLMAVAGGYQLAAGHQRLLEGLGFNFHTVTLENGEQFNVP